MFWYRNAFSTDCNTLRGHSELITQTSTEEHENWRVHNLVYLEIIGEQNILELGFLRLETQADMTLHVRV
jgi:hypothetical protein